MSTPASDGASHQVSLRGDAQAVYERRRVQNREAQRRFRSRKAQYRSVKAQWTSAIAQGSENSPSLYPCHQEQEGQLSGGLSTLNSSPSSLSNFATTINTDTTYGFQTPANSTSGNEFEPLFLPQLQEMHIKETVDPDFYSQSIGSEQDPEMCSDGANFPTSHNTTFQSQTEPYHDPFVGSQQRFLEADFALLEDFQFSTRNVMSQHFMLLQEVPYCPPPAPYSHPSIPIAPVQSVSYKIAQDLGQSRLDAPRQSQQRTPDTHSAAAHQQKPERDKWPLLHIPIENGNEVIARMLIDSGANIDERDSVRGCTALHVAVLSKQENMLRLLVESGADVNAEDDLGRTPLYEAVTNGFEAGLRILLANGADVRNKKTRPI